MGKFKCPIKKSVRQVVSLKYRRIIAGTLLLLCLSLFGCVSARRSNLTVTASPSAAADDLIYFADATGTIHALQAESGKPLWQYSLPGELAKRQNNEAGDIHIDRLFARSNKKLFGLATIETGGSAGHTILFALDSNQLLWFKDAPSAPEPNGSPVAVGSDAVYLAGNDGILYAFAGDDGRLLWQYQVSLGKIGAPTIGADRVVYVTGARQNLHAVGADGVQKWVAETMPE